MKKIRVMIVGYGNVGRGVRLSLGKNPDMELVGIVSRSPERVGRRSVPMSRVSAAARKTTCRSRGPNLRNM